MIWFARRKRLFVLACCLCILSLSGLGFSEAAWARTGGSKSVGSSGSRSLGGSSSTRSTAPSPPPPPSSSMRQGTTPPPPPPSAAMPRPPQPQTGGFMRGLAGGLLGGFVGSMLFSGMAGAGGHGSSSFGSSGPGLFDLLLIGGLIYLAYRLFFRRRDSQAVPGGGVLGRLFGGSGPGGQTPAPPPGRVEGAPFPPPPPAGMAPPSPPPPPSGSVPGLEPGLGHISSMDPAFDLQGFRDWAMDAFFQIQAAYGHRDLGGVPELITPELQDILNSDLDQLKAQGRHNRLENIAVRSVEPSEAWQEGGQDYLAVMFTANLLDFMVDDRTGQVVEGSDRQPVKFRELWTFTRPVGPGPWRLSAITQTN